MTTSALTQVLTAIDTANAKDPHLETTPTGDKQPKELLYGQRMSATLANFKNDASELLQIACRAQHLERWTLSRTDFPMNRVGYRRWRTQLAQHHAERCAELMAECGYQQDAQERVKTILQKQNIKRDAEVQTLEDVACLVFLEHYLEDFATKHPQDKLIDIIQKTWAKMSEEGHQAALKLPFSEAMLALITAALE